MRVAHYTPAYRGQMQQRVAWCQKRTARWAWEKRIEIEDFGSKGPNIDVNRNLALEDAYKRGCDYILMQDADVYARSDVALDRLLLALDVGEGHIVGAAVERRGRRRRMNCKPVYPGELYEGQVGCGLMLIDIAAVMSIPRPDGGFFQFVKTAKGLSVRTGEDIFFCKYARSQGLRVLVDYTFETVHLGEQELCSSPVQVERDATITRTPSGQSVGFATASVSPEAPTPGDDTAGMTAAESAGGIA